MPNPSATPTPITPPRVPLIDPRTGLIDRAWYMFFVSILSAAQSNDDWQKGPSTDSLLASYDAALQSLAQTTETTPVLGIAELQNTLGFVQQELQTLPRQELGTLAQLQQDNVPWLQFDTTPAGFPTGAAAHGTLYWDDADRAKTLALVMEDTGGVIQQIGEETFYRIKADSTITKGQVVMFTGSLGASGGLKGAPATGLTAFQSEYIMGVATQDIATNSWGYVTWFGEVRGVNTTGGAEAWVDGDVLFYNPAVAGGLTKFTPAAPNPKVIVASVVHAATNGTLFVRPTFGSALGQTDSNVQITGLTNNDLLQYKSAQQRWENVPATNALGTASNGQLLIGNGTGFTKATLTAGTNIAITNGSGSITIATTGLGTMALQNIGVSGTFTTADTPPKTVTVTNGVITNIV